MAVTSQLAGTVTVIDTSTTSQFIKTLAASLAGTIASISQSQLIGTVATTITLPISPTNVIYIKNLHATNTLTVTWTPNAGVSAVVQTLEPGAVLLLIQPIAGAGITALSLQASGASTPVEYILAG